MLVSLLQRLVIYRGDGNNDDQPYPMKVRKGRMFSIPYCMEVNDIPLFMQKGYTGEQYLQSVRDQFDTLKSQGRIGHRRREGKELQRR